MRLRCYHGVGLLSSTKMVAPLKVRLLRLLRDTPACNTDAVYSRLLSSPPQLVDDNNCVCTAVVAGGVALMDVVTDMVARACDNSWCAIMRHERHHKSFVTHTSSHPHLPSRLCCLYPQCCRSLSLVSSTESSNPEIGKYASPLMVIKVRMLRS